MHCCYWAPSKLCYEMTVLKLIVLNQGLSLCEDSIVTLKLTLLVLTNAKRPIRSTGFLGAGFLYLMKLILKQETLHFAKL